jgi:hypothetical protein
MTVQGIVSAPVLLCYLILNNNPSHLWRLSNERTSPISHGPFPAKRYRRRGTLHSGMPSFFPGAREQDAAAMALPPRVFVGTSLSLTLCHLAPPSVSLSREGTRCQGAYLLCWGYSTCLHRSASQYDIMILSKLGILILIS